MLRVNFTILTLTGGKQFFIVKYAGYSSDTLNRATSSSPSNESVICMNWKLQILRLLVNECRKTSETCSKILAATMKSCVQCWSGIWDLLNIVLSSLRVLKIKKIISHPLEFFLKNKWPLILKVLFKYQHSIATVKSK